MNENDILADEILSFYARNSEQLTPVQRRLLADAAALVRSARPSGPGQFVFGAIPER